MRGGVVLVLLLGAGDSFVVPPPSCRALSQLGAEGADGPAPKVPRIRKRVRKAAPPPPPPSGPPPASPAAASTSSLDDFLGGDSFGGVFTSFSDGAAPLPTAVSDEAAAWAAPPAAAPRAATEEEEAAGAYRGSAPELGSRLTKIREDNDFLAVAKAAGLLTDAQVDEERRKAREEAEASGETAAPKEAYPSRFGGWFDSLR